MTDNKNGHVLPNTPENVNLDSMGKDTNNIPDKKDLASLISEVEIEVSKDMIVYKSANLVMREAQQRPDPVSLWYSLWYENEMCCLFADSNLGKSILAVQIGAKIAETQPVIYFDFELSDKQFQLRYTNEETKAMHKFPDNLFRAEIDSRNLNTKDYENALIDCIERKALEAGAKVLIIDNLTWMANEAEKGGDAASLMTRLNKMKFDHGWSILVISHTPKRNLSNPIDQNCLAGSKKLFNFFDSVFAIGQSARDNQLRYVKQLKCRHGEFTHGSNNVIVCQIMKDDCWLHFVPIGYADEREHLRQMSDADETEMKNCVIEMHRDGKSYRDIAKAVGTSHMTIKRIVDKDKASQADNGNENENKNVTRVTDVTPNLFGDDEA